MYSFTHFHASWTEGEVKAAISEVTNFQNSIPNSSYFSLTSSLCKVQWQKTKENKWHGEDIYLSRCANEPILKKIWDLKWHKSVFCVSSKSKIFRVPHKCNKGKNTFQWMHPGQNKKKDWLPENGCLSICRENLNQKLCTQS